MTRKHFQALADEISEIEDVVARRLAAEAVARACKRMNSAFNKERFMEACKL